MPGDVNGDGFADFVIGAPSSSEALIPGRLVRRYKRFFTDVELASGEIVTVHCPNSGAMTGCATPGSEVRVSRQPGAHRKLPYTLELVRVGRTWVAVNTLAPNRVADHFISAGAVPELAGYQHQRREVRYGRASRVDILLWDGDQDGHAGGRRIRACFVEIKNTTLRRAHHACFPDAVTARGLKHLRELSREVGRGQRAVMLFFVSRMDCGRFRPAHEVDAAYAVGLARAARAGVEVLAYRFRATPSGFALDRRLPVDLTSAGATGVR